MGTGHAVKSAAQEVDRPFCVINADDFYGYDAFQKMTDFLNERVDDQHMASVGFEVGNTLSDFGYVSRGLFPNFVEKNHGNPKAEFFIPDLLDYMVKQGIANFLVHPTDTKWFGVTYKEDKEEVQQSIHRLIEEGCYPQRLWLEKKIVDESIYLDF